MWLVCIRAVSTKKALPHLLQLLSFHNSFHVLGATKQKNIFPGRLVSLVGNKNLEYAIFYINHSGMLVYKSCLLKKIKLLKNPV